MKRVRGQTTHVLKEDLEDTTSLFVNETRNTLHTTTTRQTTDSLMKVQLLDILSAGKITHGFGDSLNIVAQNLTVALSSAP